MPDPQNPVVPDPDALLTQEQDPANTNDPANPAADPDKPEIYFEEIEVEGGEPIRFEGETPEAVRDLVFDWIKNAAKGQKQETTPAAQTVAPVVPETPAPAVKKRSLSEDESFAINNEFKNGDPIKALNQFFEKSFAVTLDQVVESAQMGRNVAVTAERVEREMSAVAQFREKHPEYAGNPSNKVAMELWLRAAHKEATLPNLEEAYTSLTQAGLVKTGEAQPQQTTQQTTEQTTQQTTPQQPPAPRRTASGFFGRQGAVTRRAEPQKKGPSDNEIAKRFQEGGSDAVLQALLES